MAHFYSYNAYCSAAGGKGVINLYVYNDGAAAGSGAEVLDTLPAGVTASSATGGVDPIDNGTGENFGAFECTVEGGTVSCSLPEVRSGYIAEVFIHVEAGAVAQGSEGTNVATVRGGGAPLEAKQEKPVKFSSTLPGLGFAGVQMWSSNSDGTEDVQAGSHPYQVTFAYAMNSKGFGYVEELLTGGETRELVVNLPPGIVGNPTAMPRCTRKQFDDEEKDPETAMPSCPASTQVGVDFSLAEGVPVGFKVYNLVPPPGVPAQFAFNFEGTDVFLDAHVRSGGPTPQTSDYGISEHTSIPQREVVFNTTTLWGTPGDAAHDDQRERELPSSSGSAAFLTLPTSCGESLESTVEARGTWENPAANAMSMFSIENGLSEPLEFTGCEHLSFTPTVRAAPDTSSADTPAGLEVNVEAPPAGLMQEEGLSMSDIKNTTVALPEGVVINPGQATGLAACAPAEDALESEAAPTCPNASRVGTDEINTPLLFKPLTGDVYVLQSNPPDLKLLIAASGEGVNLKLVGNVHLNEATGQLVTTFEKTPALPFSDFKLAFSGGAQAALATPTHCGSYQTSSDFTPWSSPFLADAFPGSYFLITGGPGGSACPSSPLPFNPVLNAGSTTDQAGGYTNFSMLLQRGDGQQRIDGLQFKAPAGLTGFLSHVPLCTNGQAEANACPASSKIGHTVVESGPGPYPLVIPEAGQEPAPIYLTEAYDGAPFGLSIVVPIHAGPFTLPTQRVRAKIEIDPTTSQLTVTTNPLPQVVAGVPTDLREVDAVIERPEFMVNPTNCNPQEFSGTAYGTPPPGVSEANKSAAISTHFQVGACQALKFEPKFSVSVSGNNSKAKGARLTAKLTYPSVPQGTDADIGYVKIELPKQLPSRLTTLQKACTSAQFNSNPAACPSESKIGYATVHTPLLPVPLTGPVIFVSHGGESFPSLTVVLQGDGVTINLIGTTFISKAGITSTTFKTVPDDPFSTFELTLPQGKYSALAVNVASTAHDSLCGQKLTLPNEFVAQDGAVIKKSTAISVTGCAKLKTLTRAQKLAKALKACHKKAKSKRARCEAAARKQFGQAKSKAKKK